MTDAFQQSQLGAPRPASIRGVVLPRRVRRHPSPADWRDEVIYFLLPDRFSDGLEHTRPLVNGAQPQAARPPGFTLAKWAESGGARWQGGTLRGAASKLDYLAQLGVSTLWLGPVFRQRAHQDTYHGSSTSIRAWARAPIWSHWWAPRTTGACASSSTSSSITPATTGCTRATATSRLTCIGRLTTGAAAGATPMAH